MAHECFNRPGLELQIKGKGALAIGIEFERNRCGGSGFSGRAAGCGSRSEHPAANFR